MTVRLRFPIRTHSAVVMVDGAATVWVSHIGGTNSFSMSGGYTLQSILDGWSEDRVREVFDR